MKKYIIRRLGLILFLTILFSLCLNYYVQFQAVLKSELTRTQQIFWQMRQILNENEEESALVESDFDQICLVRAKAAAYIVQYHPEMLTDLSEMKKVARYLLVDEIHVFDKEGSIYAGTAPQYYGMNFHSGKQMQFFLPMLEDKTLELCQDITPNTAESKLMQYAAVWCEDGEKIVQVGLKPERVLKAKQKTDLSYIFSMVTVDQSTEIFAIDPDTRNILASTDGHWQGKNALEAGFDEELLSTKNQVLFRNIHDENSICVIDRTDSLILASARRSSIIYSALLRSTILLALYIGIISSIALFFIVRYLNHNIVHGIYDINDRLAEIEKGNLIVKLPPQSTPEMTELAHHVNDMVTSLINQQTKISLILESVKLPIGTFEYNTRTKQLKITVRTLEILGFPGKHIRSDIDPDLFRQRMDVILSHPVDSARNIYLIPGVQERFVHIEYFQNDTSILGIIMDVTKDLQEKHNIEHERDVDPLTSLLNRRAFYRRIVELFQTPEEIGIAGFIMIDSDNLKYVNDTYGHTDGDRYLQAISDILNRFPAKKIVARLSGDEFILFVYGCKNRKEVEKLLDHLFQMREKATINLKGNAFSVEFSAGCAFYPEDGTDYDTLQKLADQRMYEDKKARKCHS